MNHNLEEKLTAYALGEIDGVDAVEIEALLETDEEARRYVEETRAIGDIAEEAFAGESLGDERHDAVLAHMNIAPLERRRRFMSMPSQARLVALAASAVFVAGLAYVSAGYIDSGQLMHAELGSEDTAPAMAAADRMQRRLTTTHAAGVPVSATEAELSQSQLRVVGDQLDALGYAGPSHELRDSPGYAVASPGGRGGGGLGGRGGMTPNSVPTTFNIIDDRERGAQAAAASRRATAGLGTEVEEVARGSRDLTVQTQFIRRGIEQDKLLPEGSEIRVAVADSNDDSIRGRGGRGGGMAGGGLGGGGGGFGSDMLSDDLGVALGTDVTFNGAYVFENEQLHALGYIDNGVGVNANLPQVQVQLGDRFQTSRLESLALVPQQQQQPQPNTESYDRITDNPFKRVVDEPLSTFSIDVDTGSYSNVRRFLRNNQLPPKDAVRIEELLNYFKYAYTPPANDDPFAAHVELVECPWNDTHQLMRIGLKGREVEVHTRPPANLVFLLDVSGSMNNPNKLPLVRNAMKMLTKQLRPDDRVAIVTYAGASGLVLPSTPGEGQATILDAIGRLQSGGSTNGGAGIELAYKVAQENFLRNGANRVILATDGDFNVGTTDRGSLDWLIEQKAKSGVFLTVLGVGEGNLKDAMMEQLADKGNGQYAYLDTIREAQKVLVDQVSGTLVTIAKDVKIQIDFNPAQVGAYRLIGYENRVLAAQDFDDDTKDAGEIGAGHTVTALYEIVPPGVAIDAPSGTQSRYQVAAAPTVDTESNELLTVKLRHKKPDGDTSELLEIPITAQVNPLTEVSHDSRFAAAVAAFGMALRESPHRGTTDWDLIANLAEDGLGNDPQGYRAEFMEMVHVARRLKPGIALRQAAADASPVVELLQIMPWTGGTYVAEFRTQSGNTKRYGVGDQFESYRIISINPNAGKVVVYSEDHRRELVFTANN